jgi:hypothetical protein
LNCTEKGLLRVRRVTLVGDTDFQLHVSQT